ncbi:MAG: hypothetical protein J7500_02705 [Sphingomonas sp.]|uniref:hypothetical protein n=1 Tax=Sphingomonas sp. TaxID=28214 RepID=UPI001B19829B|nr:hypothetical protein [Sphingomonas sp.]MBO9621601.1 hypothetical protein [Sphingomonas sp.]
MEDIEDGAGAPFGHPVVATLAGAAVLVVGALLAPMLVPQQPLGLLLGVGAGVAVLLWAIGYVVTTRHAGAAWKAGSLGLLVAAGAGSAMIAHAQYETHARADASSFAEVEFGPGGAAQMPAGAAARGPLSRLFAESVAADAQAQRDFGAEMAKLGVGNLSSPYLLGLDPKVLSHCEAVDALEATARAQADARAARGKAMADALAAARLSDKAKQGIAAMAGAQGDALLANQRALIGATGELCRLLARRGWTNNGGYFGFASGADAARFRALTQRQAAIAAEGAQIARAAQQRMASGRDTVRDVLSRSIFSGG